MKRLILPIALAIATAAPLGAMAQEPPQGPPPGGPPSAAQRAQFRANFEQMRKARDEARAQALAALTPAHRALLASITGNLAIAEHPDFRAAVRQLDAALSPGEKSAIFAAQKQLFEQIKAMRASLPKHPWPHAAGGAQRTKHHREHRKPSAGAVLLGLASDHAMMPWGRR